LNIFAYKEPRGREHGDVDGKEEEGREAMEKPA